MSSLLAFLKGNGLEAIYSSLDDNFITDLIDLVDILAKDENTTELAADFQLKPGAITKLKRVLELRIEYVKQGGSIKPEQEDFFNQYQSIAALQKAPWTKIQQSFKSERFDYDEIGVIQKIWGSNSALRKSLIEAFLPFDLADALEKENIRSLGDIPAADFHKFVQGLTANEKKILIKIYQEKNSSNQQLQKREEAERKSLLEKIDKANQIIKQMKDSNNPSEKEEQMTELINVLELSMNWTKDDIDKALETVETAIAEVNNHLISKSTSSLSDEDLISNVSSGAALCGLIVGLLPALEVIKQAASPLIMKPDLCPIKLGSLASKVQSFTFLNEQSAENFQKTVDSIGADYGFPLQSNDDTSSTASNTLIRLTSYVFPMASFQMDRTNLTFTISALNQLRAISDLKSAEEFMLRYGSHISTGQFQLGGILWTKIQVNTDKPVMRRDLEELSKTETGSVGRKITILHSAKAEMQFEFKTLGPAVFNPSLFKQILAANSDTWHIINRGGLDSLVPIWEIVINLFPELSQQCEFMKKIWLGKTAKIPAQFINQQRTRIQPSLKSDQAASSLPANTFLEEFLKKAEENVPYDSKVKGIQNSLTSFLSAADYGVDEQHNAIENVLLNKYSWANGSFSKGITVDGILELVRDIQRIRNGTEDRQDQPMEVDELMSEDDEDDHLVEPCNQVCLNCNNYYNNLILLYNRWFCLTGGNYCSTAKSD